MSSTLLQSLRLVVFVSVIACGAFDWNAGLAASEDVNSGSIVTNQLARGAGIDPNNLV